MKRRSKFSVMQRFRLDGLSRRNTMRHQRPNHALQRTRRERRGCNRCVPCAGSLSLGRCKMKDELTAFQLEVEKGINDLLDHLGKHVVDRRIAGIGETYITGSVSNQDIT